MKKKICVSLIVMVVGALGFSGVSGIPHKNLTDVQIKNLEALTNAKSSSLEVVCSGTTMDKCVIRCTSCGLGYVGQTERAATLYRGQCPACGGWHFSFGPH